MADTPHDDGSPVPTNRLKLDAWLLAGATALAAGAAYLITSAPGPYWGDGMELSTAATVLGVPHPTGYPLYMMLGHAAIRLMSFVEPARAMTLFSLAMCVIAAGLATRVFVGHVTGGVWSNAPDLKPSRRHALIAMGAGLLFAFSRAVWDHATFPEVYPLTLAFAMAILVMASAPAPPTLASAWRRLAAMAALWGLAALNHYSIILLAPLTILTLIDWARRVDPARPARRAAIFIAAHTAIAALFLSGYAYLPLRARANPPLNWGDVRTLDQVIWIMRGGDYVAWYKLKGDSALSAAARGLEFWAGFWARQILDLSDGPDPGDTAAPRWIAPLIGGLIISGAVAGLVLARRRRRAYAWGLLAALALTFLIAVFYRIPDLDGYFLAAIVIVIIGWIELIRWALARWPGFQSGGSQLQRLARTAALLPLAAAGAVFFALFPVVNKSWDDGPRRWADNLFKVLPENAMILTRGGADSEIFTLWYEQFAMGKRRDLVIFGGGFIFQGWYKEHFARNYPGVDVFIMARPPLSKDIYDAALIAGVVIPNFRQRRIFTTDYRDPTLQDYMNLTPAGELLPREYYHATGYRINLPSPYVFELHPDPAQIPIFREAFIERFGQPPPGE